MDIKFSQERWQKIIDDSNKWWEGSLDRPLIQAKLQKNKTNFPAFHSFYPLDTPAEKIIDDCNDHLASFKYFGDAFPEMFPNFGAGVIAAFLGSKLTNGENTVWFHPDKDREIKDIKFEYNPENVWYKRIKIYCICRTGKMAGKSSDSNDGPGRQSRYSSDIPAE